IDPSPGGWAEGASGPRIPDPDSLLAGRREAAAVGAERHAENGAGMVGQAPNLLAGGRVPDDRGSARAARGEPSARAARGEPSAVGAERQTPEIARLPV